jgi:uncharacterized damage-inducible protein DinB
MPWQRGRVMGRKSIAGERESRGGGRKRMKSWMKVMLVAAGMLCMWPVKAQEKKVPEAAPTVASVLDKELSVVEKEVVSAAEAMPEEKYGFVPTGGEFKGVRTFGEQVRHIAAANNMFFGGVFGEKADFEVVEKGPVDVKTKAQIVEYLKASFAKGHKAIATITAENAVTKLEGAAFALVDTRLGLTSFACAHAFDHYGQIVVYLRLNGIVPPASRGN